MPLPSRIRDERYEKAAGYRGGVLSESLY